MLFPTSYVMKPPIGAPILGHPLTPNVAVWLFNEGSGNKVYDIIGKNHGTFGAGAAAPSWVPEGLNFDGGDYIDLGTFTTLDGAHGFSIVFDISPNSLPFSSNGGIFARGSTGQRTPWVFGFNGKSYLGIQAETLGGVGDLNLKTDNLVANVSQQLCFTWDGIIAKSFINTAQGSNTDTASNNTLVNTDGDNYIGYIDQYGYIDAIIKYIFIYDYALQPSQITQLHINPYCWLAQPMEAELFFVPVGGQIYNMTATDILKGYDAQTAQLAFIRNCSDILKGVDTDLANITFGATCSDILKGVDTEQANITFMRAVSDIFKGADTVSGIIGILRTAVDILKLTDTPTAQLVFAGTAIDISKLTDSNEAVITFTVNASDIFKGIDTGTGIREFLLECVDIMKHSDATQLQVQFGLSAMDITKHTDTSRLTVTFYLSASDILKGIDMSSWFEVIEGKKIFVAQGKILVFKAQGKTLVFKAS